MELGPRVADFKPPPHPKGISLDGKLVQLVPIEAEEHAEALFEVNQLDTEGTNWAYLPYGPFADLKSYHSWVKDNPSRWAALREAWLRALHFHS